MLADGRPTKAVVILDRTGGGQVSVIPFDTDKEKIPSRKSDVQQWPHIKGLRDFAAAVAENQLFIIGGFDTEKRLCSEKVWRYVFC